MDANASDYSVGVIVATGSPGSLSLIACGPGGVSFATFDESGRAQRTAYASNIFAPQPRYLIDIH